MMEMLRIQTGSSIKFRASWRMGVLHNLGVGGRAVIPHAYILGQRIQPNNSSAVKLDAS